jgi:fructose-bisphosphate aldolase class I
MEIDSQTLRIVAERLVKPGKGILAADESVETAGKRLELVGLQNTEENRRTFRDIFLATSGIEQYLSGIILYHETLFQESLDGRAFVHILKDRGILVGIKVDLGVVDFPGFPGERLTEGLDGLRERLVAYRNAGAEFTKFRCVFRIGDNIPTMECIHLNAITLARYARIAQEEGFVPIVEPEVLLDGNHTIERAEEVTRKVLDHMFYECQRLRADLSCMILKTSMILDGAEGGIEASEEAIAEATVRVLTDLVPKELPGVVFLSGGQTHDEAVRHYAAIARKEPFPWEVSFSFARALQEPVLARWMGKDENIDSAREEFLLVLERAVAADKGKVAPSPLI